MQKLTRENPLLFITHSVWYPDAVHLLLVCAYDTDKEIWCQRQGLRILEFVCKESDLGYKTLLKLAARLMYAWCSSSICPKGPVGHIKDSWSAYCSCSP